MWKKKLYLAFIDLEKAFDRLPREVMIWAWRKLGVEEWLLSTVISLYCGANTTVRTGKRDSNIFKVKDI